MVVAAVVSATRSSTATSESAKVVPRKSSGPPPADPRDIRTTGFWKYQSAAEQLYIKDAMQFGVAGLICGNFLANMVQAQIDPYDDKYTSVFEIFEYFFNVMFTIELAINMYAFWCKRFWSSSWNIFDFVVVSIGLLTSCKIPLPGPMTLLRNMRAFRVFRLFKRVESLAKIMRSLVGSVPGVANAFLILCLVMSIYAILGVEFYKTYGDNGVYTNWKGEEMSSVTARGHNWGYEYFGNFCRSWYTLWQVLTGDSWSEAIARPLISNNKVVMVLGSAFFFVSFVLLCALVLVNVVVAVLLESMVSDPDADDNGEDVEFVHPPEESDDDAETKADDDIQDVQGGVNTENPDKAGLSCNSSSDLRTAIAEVDELKEQIDIVFKAMQQSGIICEGDLLDENKSRKGLQAFH